MGAAPDRGLSLLERHDSTAALEPALYAVLRIVDVRLSGWGSLRTRCRLFSAARAAPALRREHLSELSAAGCHPAAGPAPPTPASPRSPGRRLERRASPRGPGWPWRRQGRPSGTGRR